MPSKSETASEVTWHAFRDELVKIAGGASNILQQRAADLWKGRSRAAEAAGSLLKQRAADTRVAQEAARAAGKKGKGFFAKLLGE